LEDTQNTIQSEGHYILKSRSTALRCQETALRTAGRAQSGRSCKVFKKGKGEGKKAQGKLEKAESSQLKKCQIFLASSIQASLLLPITQILQKSIAFFPRVSEIVILKSA